MLEVDKLAPKLTAAKSGSFAFATVSERWPKILSKIVDHFHRHRKAFMAEHGEDADVDVKSVIHELSEMRYRLATDKPLERLSDEFDDARKWNTLMEAVQNELGKTISWFHFDWLFVECYLYRRVFGCLQKTKHLKEYDYFAEQKSEGLEDHLPQTVELIHFLHSNCVEGQSPLEVRTALVSILKICLWGNQCDLSLSSGEKGRQVVSPVASAAARDSYILVDEFDEAVDQHLLKLGGGRQVDVVLDNAGFELLGDLILAEFLLSNNLADRIVLHGKEFPWFVSDVVRSDVDSLVARLSQIDDVHCKWAAQSWKQRLDEGTFVYKADPFWTSPHAYCDMKKYSSPLYTELSESSLLVFKGDLNYRKLVGDRDWPFTTDFKAAVRGFCPAPLLALRTLKAETVAGLSPATVEQLRSKFGDSKEWMVSGDYAVVQFGK